MKFCHTSSSIWIDMLSLFSYVLRTYKREVEPLYICSVSPVTYHLPGTSSLAYLSFKQILLMSFLRLTIYGNQSTLRFSCFVVQDLRGGTKTKRNKNYCNILSCLVLLFFNACFLYPNTYFIIYFYLTDVYSHGWSSVANPL